jgi:DNA invertase Pin-like site-specific DNA recombinase
MSQKGTQNAYVSCQRVSTQRQGRSGLGLEAQREAVQRFVADRAGKTIAEFVEVDSGKRNDRPQLDKAIRQCRLTGATLVVAKLDRLSRNAAFLLTLRDSGVSFIAADLPEANTMTVGVMAVVAQHEAEAISKRTKEALEAARNRGKVLGGVRVNAPDITAFGEKANRAVAEKARQDAELRRDVLESLVHERISMNAMAARLNEASVRTARGGAWTATAVKRTLARLAVSVP